MRGYFLEKWLRWILKNSRKVSWFITSKNLVLCPKLSLFHSSRALYGGPKLPTVEESYLLKSFPSLPAPFIIMSPPSPLSVCSLPFPFALQLSRFLPGTSTVSIGVASGIVFCGIVGHSVRHEYTGVLSQVISPRLAPQLCGRRGNTEWHPGPAL